MVQKGHFMIYELVKRAPDEFISLKLKEYISQAKFSLIDA